MDLQSLRYFQAVARREHLSQAAAELRVAQPSLSRTIARLEAEVGVPLFDRPGRRLKLNPFGEAFLARIDRALHELDDAKTELADAAGLSHGRVALAVETLLTITGLVTSFKARHPGVDLSLYQSTPDRMAEQLRTGEVDLCFASQPVAGESLRRVEVLREPVGLVVPRGHRLAHADRVGLDDLVDEPFIITRPGHWQRTLLDQLFEQLGRRPRIVCESDEPGATPVLIAAGLGVGLVPAMSRPALAEVPGVWVDLDHPAAERTLTVIWREDTYHSAAAVRLRDQAIDQFRLPSSGEARTRDGSIGQ